MKLVIVRHGDPDYEHDTLTETGWKEAELVADRICRLEVRDFYVSPLGRAQDTASCTLKRLGRTAETMDWLQEFPPKIYRPDSEALSPVCWDWLPQDWTTEPKYYDVDTWADTEIMRQGHVRETYDMVCKSLDRLLAEHGYVREGNYYRVEKPNNDTLVFFCHFGLECVLVSHLAHVSPMILWHNFCAAPTSVTTAITEERREGIASFRVSGFGDTSHLYAGGREPSFSARFCECYTNADERHD